MLMGVYVTALGPGLPGIAAHAHVSLAGVAGGQAVAAITLVRSAFPPLPAVPHGTAEAGLRQLVRQPLLWLLGLLLFLYVGLEAGLGSWAYTYLRLHGGFGVVAASLL